MAHIQHGARHMGVGVQRVTGFPKIRNTPILLAGDLCSVKRHDHWTDLGEWTDSKGKRHKDADSPRYKALGNSIALPPWKWLLKRLCGNYERDATMASLFDGIGGFPLIWEQLNGRGTCLWASEIEEFPIAVTKRRFGTLEEPGDMGRFLFPCGNERSGT